MMQSKITNKYPPARWTAIKRFLAAALRKGRKASSITTTLAAASVTKTMPAAIADIFNTGVHPSEPDHTMPMFSLAPTHSVSFDVGGHSHSVGVNSLPPRFIPERGVLRPAPLLIGLAPLAILTSTSIGGRGLSLFRLGIRWLRNHF